MMALKIFKSASQEFYRMFSSWSLPDVSLIISLEFCVFEEEDTEGKCSSQHFISKV